MSDYPAWTMAEEDPAIPGVEVDWTRLPDGWQAMNHRNRAAGESREAYANRLRALAAEGIIAPAALALADHLER